MVRKRSCPAVSQICSLIRFPSSSRFLILKSMLWGREGGREGGRGGVSVGRNKIKRKEARHFSHSCVLKVGS